MRNWIAGALIMAALGGAVAAEEMRAVCVIHPTPGNRAEGTVWFIQTDDKMKIIADVQGLAPNAQHGFHIHEWGDCTAPNASSAGAHYNPEGHEHGGPKSDARHAGDLGNLQADKDGKAHLELVVDDLTIQGGRNPILGRSIIVHAGADDLKSQPSGNAGDRIGCGVIGLAKPGGP